MNIKIRKEFLKTFKIAKLEYFYKLITSIGIRGILLLIPLLFGYVINDVTCKNYEKAVILCLILIIVAAIYKIIEVLNKKSYFMLYNKIYTYYNNLALDKTKDNSLFSLSRFDIGEYNNILTTDTDLISLYFSALVIRIVLIIEFLIVFVYFYYINIYIFFMALILTITLYIISLRDNNKIQKLNEKSKNEYDKMNSSVIEYFSGIKEIKSFNIFEKIVSNVKSDTLSYLNASEKYNVTFFRNNSIILYFFEFVRMLSIIFGIYLISIGKMELGALIVIFNYYQKIIENFLAILTVNVETRGVKVSLARFNKLIEYTHKKENKTAGPLHIDGNIVFKKILYGYKTNPTLKNISFDIKPNTITVLTGRNEVAQNAVFDLLLKLNRQHTGDILIDNIDINDIDDDDYFSFISMSRKPSYFFNMSIINNLKMIDQDENHIIEMCKKIGLHDEIMALPSKYETIMKPNIQVNESFKELLSIARMFLKNSKILLFDDTINNLSDPEQIKILKLLNNYKKSHTIIVIGHEKYILKNADKIIEFN
ncbi:MAG: ABC transporter ATP-binding protein [Bacilli bacterium]